MYFEVPCCDVTSNVAQPDKKLLPGGNSVFFFTFSDCVYLRCFLILSMVGLPNSLLSIGTGLKYSLNTFYLM